MPLQNKCEICSTAKDVHVIYGPYQIDGHLCGKCMAKFISKLAEYKDFDITAEIRHITDGPQS